MKFIKKHKENIFFGIIMTFGLGVMISEGMHNPQRFMLKMFIIIIGFMFGTFIANLKI